MTIERPFRLALLTPGLVCVLLVACSSSTPHAVQRNRPIAHPTVGRLDSASAISPDAPSSGDGGGGSTSVNPCSLLSQAEVDAAAGRPLGHGNRVGALDDCQWSTSDFARSVEVDVGDWSAIKAKSTLLGQTLTSVSGIGDEALSLNAAGNAAQLYVRTGTTGFLLLLGGGQYIGSLPDLGLASEKVLATAVLGRL
jgi:hypothetical protein